MQNVPIKMVHLFSCLSCFYRFYLLVDHFTIHTLYLAQPFKFLPCLDLCKGIKFAKRHQTQSNRVFLLEAYSKRIYIFQPQKHTANTSMHDSFYFFFCFSYTHRDSNSFNDSLLLVCKTYKILWYSTFLFYFEKKKRNKWKWRRNRVKFESKPKLDHNSKGWMNRIWSMIAFSSIIVYKLYIRPTENP